MADTHSYRSKFAYLNPVRVNAVAITQRLSEIGREIAFADEGCPDCAEMYKTGWDMCPAHESQVRTLMTEQRALYMSLK